MPISLRLPGESAAAEPQKSRCSLPGDSDCGKHRRNHVVVEILAALLVLRRIDRAQVSL